MKYEESVLIQQKKNLEMLTPWILAARPKTLTASLAPVLVGTLLAKNDVDSLNWVLAAFALISAILIQIGINLINDALDFKKGADTKDRLGPIRVTQAGLLSFKHVLMGGFFCFALALLCGIPLILQGGWPVFIVLLICVINGYLYTGGPSPLAYSGLGDICVFIFFGLVLTCTVFYLQTGILDGQAWLAGTQMGLLGTVLIAINNLRDHMGDAKAQKKTLAVRFGPTFARLEITFLSFAPFFLGLLWIGYEAKWVAILPLLN